LRKASLRNSPRCGRISARSEGRAARRSAAARRHLQDRALRLHQNSEKTRTLADYIADLRENQTSIFYLVGDDLKRLAQSPQIEEFSARGVEVLLLDDAVDAFWVTSCVGFEGKPFKS